MGGSTMRAVLIVVMSIFGMGSANAETWVSRTGVCFEWEGRWEVNQGPNGMWVGDIEFIHIGGRCANPTHQVVTNPVRAVIAGEEFFGSRGPCIMSGRLRGNT